MPKKYAYTRIKQESDRLPVPTDWTVESNNYAIGLICCPDSPTWRSYVRGALSLLGIGWYYDKTTGDHLQARSIGNDIAEGVCFVNCEDIVSALDSIASAIANQPQASLSGVVQQLDDINSTLQGLSIDVDTTGIENKLNTLASIADRVDELGTDVFNASLAVNDVKNQIALEGDDLQTTLNTIALDFSNKLFDLDDVLERTLAYTATGLDFYGQTMTTQTGVLTLIAQRILEKEFSVNINTTEKIFVDYPDPPGEPGVIPIDDACISAMAYTTMQGQALEQLDAIGAPAMASITRFADVYYRSIREILTAFLTLQPYVALSYALETLQLYTSSEYWPPYGTLAIELANNRHVVECGYFQFLRQEIDNEQLQTYWTDNLSAELAQFLTLADLTTFAIYAIAEFAGDNSEFWANFNRQRAIESDGYSSGYCDDCSGNGGGA